MFGFVTGRFCGWFQPIYASPHSIFRSSLRAANPYSFFGIGVAENMEDTQLMMNGFMRMR